MDLEDMRELVKSLISPLQRSVYFENKKKLYYQDGLGLSFALEADVHAHIERGDAFYYNVFTKQPASHAASLPQLSGRESQDKSEGEGDAN